MATAWQSAGCDCSAEGVIQTRRIGDSGLFEMRTEMTEIDIQERIFKYNITLFDKPLSHN